MAADRIRSAGRLQIIQAFSLGFLSNIIAGIKDTAA